MKDTAQMTREELEEYGRQLAAWAESDDFYTAMETAVAHTAQEEILTRSRALASGIKGGRPDLYSTNPTGPSPTIQFRVTKDLSDLLKERAKAEHKTQSQVAREALAYYLLAS